MKKFSINDDALNPNFITFKTKYYSNEPFGDFNPYTALKIWIYNKNVSIILKEYKNE